MLKFIVKYINLIENRTLAKGLQMQIKKKMVFLFIALITMFSFCSIAEAMEIPNLKNPFQSDERSKIKFKKPKNPYDLSICAIFQDEGAFLKEWIEYHLIVGVQHFYLYNNNSHDNYVEILAPYVTDGIVELVDWPSAVEGESWLTDQRKAYNHCIEQCTNKTRWLALIDIDEFIFPVEKTNIIDFLAEFDSKPKVGGIQINWQLYGTSNLLQIPKGKLMVESLIYKAPWDYSEKLGKGDGLNNRTFKTILRPESVKICDIHYAKYIKGYFVLPYANFDNHQTVDISKIRINHYWTRNEDYFYEYKINRRLRFRKQDGYVEIMLKKLVDLNQVQDKCMEKYVPELRKRVFGK